VSSLVWSCRPPGFPFRLLCFSSPSIFPRRRVVRLSPQGLSNFLPSYPIRFFACLICQSTVPDLSHGFVGRTSCKLFFCFWFLFWTKLLESPHNASPFLKAIPPPWSSSSQLKILFDFIHCSTKSFLNCLPPFYSDVRLSSTSPRSRYTNIFLQTTGISRYPVSSL